MRSKEIGVVHVLSEGEQIAVVQTQEGWFIVGSIPDARRDTLLDVPVLKRVGSIDEAEEWYNKRFGLTTHGGARKGAGRKPLAEEPTESSRVTMPASYWQYVRELGGGNASAGIRKLIEVATAS